MGVGLLFVKAQSVKANGMITQKHRNRAMGSRFRNKSGLKRISVLLTVIVSITWLGLHGCSDSSVAPDFQDYNDLPDAVEYEVITDQLEIPWQMAFLPDGRILITERNGLVRVVENEIEIVWV